MSFESIDHDEPEVVRVPTVSPWRGFVEAFTGRRIAEYAASHDDGRDLKREVAAITAQLAAAQDCIARMGRELKAGSDALDKALGEAEHLRMLLRSEREEVDRLARRTPLTAYPGYTGPLEPVVSLDRRALYLAENRIAELEGRPTQ